ACGDLIEERLQECCVSFPPEIDVAALNSCYQRCRSHRSHSLTPARRFWPTAHRGVYKDEFAHCVRILRIDLGYSFVHLERFLPLTLPAFNRRDQAASISVAR